MTWVWVQSEGRLFRDGRLISYGYSGKGRGKNNPALQSIAGVGPIPTGRWRIGAPYKSERVGPFTLPLYAEDGGELDRHEATGRSAFRMHGDSIKAPGTASKGCIILPRAVREAVWRSGDRALVVRP
jgi:hypothetical protein